MKSAYNQILNSKFAFILNAESMSGDTDVMVINKCVLAG